MNIPSHTLKLILAGLLSIPFSLSAESWSCRHDNDVREIHIQYETDAPLPCNVVYKKLTEGVEDQVLWSASNDPNYCEEKARAFVDKQTAWGWTCVETISDNNDSPDATTETTSDTATDDTDAATSSPATESSATEDAPAESSAPAATTGVSATGSD